MGKKKLTQKRLKELLRYDPETGEMVWLVARSNIIKPGDTAGGLGSDGYWRIRTNNKLYRRARLAFLYMEGYFPEHQVDHWNRVRIDDRWVNLRHATHACNMQNRGVQVNNTSGVTGIRWRKKGKKWRVRYRGIYYGSYQDFTQAFFVNKTVRAKFLTCFTGED